MHAHAYIFTHMFTCHNTNPYLIISRCWNGNTASQRVNTRHKIQFYTNTYARFSPTCGIYQCKIYTHSDRSQTHAQSPLPALTHTHARHTWLLRSRNTEQEKKKKQQKHQLQANRVSEFSSMRITLNAIIIREIFMVLKTSFTSFHVR